MFLDSLPRIENKDGTIRHICKEGSRQHVLSYHGRTDRRGKMHGITRCSEAECEINKEAKKLEAKINKGTA